MMTEEEKIALYKKIFAGTIYEHVGNPEIFKKVLEEQEKILQARWLAKCEETGGMYERYEYTWDK